MIKRTPQEIADFFGCYVFQGCDRDNFYITKGKPGWNGADFVLHCDGMLSLIDKSVVDIPSDYDWTVLYSPNLGTNQQADEGISPESGDAGSYYGTDPHPDNKVESYYQNRPDFDNKHQYEVHAHREYKVVCYTYENSLNEAVTSMMSEGWKPQGSIAIVYLGETYSPPTVFAQAMVRGV